MNEIVLCERCCAPCRANPERRAEARLLRHADRGVCVNCGITLFLKGTPPISTLLAARGASVLLGKAVQAQVSRIILAGQADAHPDEIDWMIVVAQWEL